MTEMKRWQQNDLMACGFKPTESCIKVSAPACLGTPNLPHLWRQLKSELIFRKERCCVKASSSAAYGSTCSPRGAQCQSIKLVARLFLCWPHAPPPAGVIEECLCLSLPLSFTVNTSGQVWLCPVTQTHAHTPLSLIKSGLSVPSRLLPSLQRFSVGEPPARRAGVCRFRCERVAAFCI